MEKCLDSSLNGEKSFKKLCKHHLPCWENAVRGFLSSMSMGIGIKVATNFFSFILSKKKSVNSFK